MSVDNLFQSLIFNRKNSMGAGMRKPTDKKQGLYFDDDIGMGARALMEMFGDDVVTQVSRRLSEVRAEGGKDRVRYWETLLEEIVKRKSS